jgi:hypothetical protein
VSRICNPLSGTSYTHIVSVHHRIDIPGLVYFVDNYKSQTVIEGIAPVITQGRNVDIFKEIVARYPHVSGVAIAALVLDENKQHYFLESLYGGVSKKQEFFSWFIKRFKSRGSFPLLCTYNTQRLLRLVVNDDVVIKKASTVNELYTLCKTRAAEGNSYHAI